MPKGNIFSSARRFPSSSPQRCHSPTGETLAIVDVNDPSIIRNNGTTSGNIAVGSGGVGMVVGAKKPSCRVCKKTFNSRHGVNGHMRVHPKGKRGRTSPTARSRRPGGATGSQGT